jgi:hypothetical protein
LSIDSRRLMDMIGIWHHPYMGERKTEPVPAADACKFCGAKKEGDPRDMRENPTYFVDAPGVAICTDCVSLCVEILDEKKVDWMSDDQKALYGKGPASE